MNQRKDIFIYFISAQGRARIYPPFLMMGAELVIPERHISSEKTEHEFFHNLFEIWFSKNAAMA